MVLCHLDDISLVCLKHTNSRFRAPLALNGDKLSLCANWMIMCRFEDDMIEYPATVACAFCKVKRPVADLGYDSKFGFEHLRMMNARPLERYCRRHAAYSLRWPKDRYYSSKVE